MEAKGYGGGGGCGGGTGISGGLGAGRCYKERAVAAPAGTYSTLLKMKCLILTAFKPRSRQSRPDNTRLVALARVKRAGSGMRNVTRSGMSPRPQLSDSSARLVNVEMRLASEGYEELIGRA